MKAAFGRWTVAVVVSFLLLCPHLKIYTVEATRYEAFWGRRDALAIAAAALLPAALFFFALRLTRMLKLWWLDRFFDAIFVLVFCLAAVACLHEGVVADLGVWKHPVCITLTAAACILALSTVIFKSKRIRETCANGCLILSPTVPIVLILLFTYPEFSAGREPLPAAEGREARQVSTPLLGAHNVYLFIFDEWSYQRTFKDLEANSQMPNLCMLAKGATVYHEAHSPHRSTSQSLPRILFQTTDEYTFGGGRVGFRSHGAGLTPVGRHRNLFTVMKEAGYLTYLVGWAHPYRRMFGGELDFCWSSPSGAVSAVDDSFTQAAARQLRLGLSRSTMAIPKPAPLKWRVERFWKGESPRQAVRMLATIHDLAQTILRDRRGPCFSVFHYPLPHWPLIYERNGINPNASRDHPLHFTATADGTRAAPDPENYIIRYAGNLRYLDTIIGEIIDALKAADTWDGAMIILTSDHTWRADPQINDDPASSVFTHVPLVIKFPHERRPAAVEAHFNLTDLGQLIEATVLSDDPGRTVEGCAEPSGWRFTRR